VTIISSLTVPAIVDVEASGFGAQSYPIEIGVALLMDSVFVS